MREAIARGQSLARHVGVDLRGSETRVAEHLLYRPQVSATIEQMRGARVTQRMRADVASRHDPDAACHHVIDGAGTDTRRACCLVNSERPILRVHLTENASAQHVVGT